jgi:hypothetical protein
MYTVALTQLALLSIKIARPVFVGMLQVDLTQYSYHCRSEPSPQQGA